MKNHSYQFILVILVLTILISGCNDKIVDETANGSRPVIRPAGEYFYAAWGPNDRLAVIYVQRTGIGESQKLLDTWGLYTIRTDGTDRQLVLLNSDVGDFILNPVWSSDGEWIAFSADGEIFKVRPDGSDLTRLTYGGESKFRPSWSPDRKWLAYRVIYGPDEVRGLWKVSSEGDSVKQFRRPPRNEMCIDCGDLDRWVVYDGPHWSFNSNELTYVAFKNYDIARYLAVYDTTTARVKFIYIAPSGIYHPSFSPDGSKILFNVGRLNGHPGGIALINRDGSGLRWLRQDGEDPSWSPDGKQIVYRLDNIWRRGEPGYGDLWIMNADGSGNTQITFSTGRKK
jgi:Tol biopolymer transport system component